MQSYCKRGFTFIEMLIIIVIIAILSLIVIPRILMAGQKAREAELLGDLHQLRGGIAQFKEDCGGIPANLDQLMTKPSKGSLTGDSDNELNLDGWQGPYVHTEDGLLPKDPFTGKADYAYDMRTGEVHSACTSQYTLETRLHGGKERISDL